MKLTILEDAKKRPGLFCWAGEPPALDSWVKERGWSIPEDLRHLWCETGGGDFFDEGETIFAPFSDLAYKTRMDPAQVSAGFLFYIRCARNVRF